MIISLVFSSERTARIKIGKLTGDWLESDFGTSAGMRLGPLLFIFTTFLNVSDPSMQMT